MRPELERRNHASFSRVGIQVEFGSYVLFPPFEPSSPKIGGGVWYDTSYRDGRPTPCALRKRKGGRGKFLTVKRRSSSVSLKLYTPVTIRGATTTAVL